MDPENDQTETTETTETTEETTEVTEEVEQKPEEKPEDDLPEWARKELTKVRNEAAGYRTRLRDAEDKLKDAKTPEQFESAVAEIKASNAALERSLLVTKVAAKYELPEGLAARLQGDDEAAIEADAKSLAALVTTPKSTPESLSGGLTPGESDEEFDPVAAAHEAKKRRY